MGLKKYEIITVGSDKRVRALRSWAVGDRYVNIGDVGGIVYDEKTLSQEGACWLFRGNFGFPGARIGGDSIVDVGEAALSAAGAPAVDILGSSVLVGGKLQFQAEQTTADAVVLTKADFEQGGYASLAVGQKPGKDDSAVNFIRTKNPVYMGGKSITIKTPVPGYIITILVTDADGYIIAPYKTVITDDYQSIPTEAGQYAYIRLTKNPAGPTVPADATTAAITFTGTYETKLSIVDSRVEINPANATGTATIRPGGVHTIASGVKYPVSVIRNSKVVINGHATANRIIRLMSEFIGCNVAIDATSDNAQSVGIYSNVKNLMFTGAVSADSLNVNVPRGIQATDCDNFAVSPTIFPGLRSARPADRPFIFQGCNVPNGRFYNHAQIANTYKNIDFAKASADLGKSIASDGILASSEVEGMYRIYWSYFGALVESYDSVKSLNIADLAKSYGTTIYKDAYVNGLFDIAGTNVFGNKVRSHPLAQVLNVQPRVVQGMFNTATFGETITGVVANANRVVTPKPFRINSGAGLSVNNIPTGVEVIMLFTTAGNVINTSFTGNVVPAYRLAELQAYLVFKKTVEGPITPEDLAGVTVTVYNGCKIMNTSAGAGATAVNMKGNIRVEDNATIVNAGVTGTGYFGDNSVVYYNPAVWAALDATGTVHMKDNAVFAPIALTGACALVHMEGNAKFTGSVDVASTNLSFIMRDNAVIEGKANTRSGVVMSGNSKVTATGQIMSDSRGALVMKDNASIEANTTVIGAITLAGNYKGNVVKTWIGKRTITDVNEPKYDNNVKSKYDL